MADEKAPAPEKAPKASTALVTAAKTFDEQALAFRMTDAVRKQELLAEAAAKLAETSWGMKLSPVARMGVARYAMETGTDPVRHWEVLGGKMYDKADLYYDLVAAQPDFLRDDVEFIHDDPGLGGEERARRQATRERWGAPHEAKGIAVVTLYFRDRGPFVGVNWAGRGRKTADGKMQDPVGENEPTKTAHTRAYRKAAKKAVPLWFLNHPWAERVHQQIAQGEALAAAAEAVLREQPSARGTTWTESIAHRTQEILGAEKMAELAPGAPTLDDESVEP